MDGIVRETWLTRLVAHFGDLGLENLMAAVYHSGVFTVIMMCSLSIAIMALGWSLHRKTLSQKAVYALCAVFLATPSDGKPIGYRLVNALGSGLATIVDRGVNAVIKNPAGDNMPAGIAMELLVSAASSKIKNQDTRTLLHGFVLNCLPNALTTSGKKASFDDLFNFKTSYQRDSITGQTVIAFTDTVMDTRALANDDSFADVVPGKDCEYGLKEMRLALMRDLKDDPALVSDRIVSGSREGGTVTTLSDWLERWQARKPAFDQLAMNLRLAHAAEYEKSKIVSDYGFDMNDPLGNWWQGTGTDRSIRELVMAMDYTTELGYRTSDFKNIAANVTGKRWAFSLGASIKDLKERIELLPYTMAALQLLLKLICPLAIITLFFHTFRFFLMWAGAWTASLLLPSIVNAMRSVHNSILLSKLGLEELTSDVGNKALAFGVDLSLAKNLLTDFVPLAYAMIEQEIAVMSVLAGAMLVGGWLAGGGANSFVSMLQDSVQGFFVHSTISRAADVTGRSLGALGAGLRGKSLPDVGGGPTAREGSSAHGIASRYRTLAQKPGGKDNA